MTEHAKQERAFFVEKLAGMDWGESETERILDFFDPMREGMNNAERNLHLQKRLSKFTTEFMKWLRVQPELEQSPVPMTDAEIDALAVSIK